MAITYVNNLGLSEMATGDNSGTWGNVTNVNLELIGQALGHGTRVIADASQDTITMSDGTADDDRALYLKLTGGGQACTVTLLPATMSKVWIMENGTAAALTFTQGSGANVTIPAGDTKVIACTGGAGTAQIVYDVFASLSVVDLKVQDDLTVTDDVSIGGLLTVTGGALLNGTTPTLTIGDAGAEDAKIVFDGNAQDYHVGLDDSEDALQIGLGSALGTTPRVTVRVAEVAINDLGIADCDFRVESNSFDHMFFINGGLNNTAIGFNALPENQGAGLGILTGSGNGGVHLFREDGSFPSADESLGSFGWSGADSSGNLSTADAKITAFANENMAAGDAGTKIQFYTKADGVNQGTAPTSQMIISSTGFVGIGTGNALPLHVLDLEVSATGAIPTDEAMSTSTANNNYFGFHNVSDSATFSGLSLETRTSGAARWLIANEWQATYLGDLVFRVRDGGSSSSEVLRLSSDGSLSTPTAGTSNFRAGVNAGNSIASGGNYNVCIGDEAGTTLATADNNVIVGYAAGAAINSSNNVLIGTEAGESLAAGAQNVAIGAQALQNEDGHGENVAIGFRALQDLNGAAEGNNVAVGYKAGLNATTSLFSTYVGSLAGGLGVITGNTNTAVGYTAGYDLTSGSANVLVGGNAGANLTTGQDNVAIGTSALLEDVDGNISVAIGRNALSSQTGTDADMHNTAVGFEAGKTSTTGRFNTFIGSVSAGNGVTTGTSNTAVGVETLYALTSGNDNCIMGFQAGSKITTGAHNVAIGREALETEDTGSASTAVGHLSLRVQNNDALNHNTGLGYQSGVAITEGTGNTVTGSFSGHNLTTGDNNTILGFNLGVGSATGVGQIVIGSNIVGGGVNSVRIGTSAGNATLELDGTDTSWAASSDSRLKKDVADCAVGLDFIKDLRPITYKWDAKDAIANTLPQYDADSSDPVYGSGKTKHGFIAQEVKTAIDAHSGLKNGFTMWSEDPNGTQQIAPAALIPMLVNAIQELEARIAVLEG